MNLRCSFCQTPFTIGRIEKLDALQHMEANNLKHYDAHCPRCRRATPVTRERLEMSMPNWREELKALEKEMTAHPLQEAPLPKPEPAPAPKPESRQRSRSVKKAEVKTPKKESPQMETKPAAKPKTAKKPAEKPKTTKKPASKKPAAKKTTTKKKGK